MKLWAPTRLVTAPSLARVALAKRVNWGGGYGLRQAGHRRHLVKQPPPEDGQDVHRHASGVKAAREVRDGGRPSGHGILFRSGLSFEKRVETVPRRPEERRVRSERGGRYGPGQLPKARPA